jgi:hypothetical protein
VLSLMIKSLIWQKENWSQKMKAIFVLAICLNQVLNIRWSHICFCYFSESISCFSAIADCKSMSSHSYAWKVPVLLLYSPILSIGFDCYQYHILRNVTNMILWIKTPCLSIYFFFYIYIYILMGCSGQHLQHSVSVRRSMFQWCL